MGTTNFGNQVQTVKYYDPADSDILNRRNVTIEARGIYQGGLLSKVADSIAELSPLVCEIGDAANQLRIETQSVVTLTVGPSTPYIVLRWGYVASVANYMDILAVGFGDLQANDLIVGMCSYSGPTLIGFDYGLRTVVMRLKEFLAVIPTETASMKVHIKGGWTSYGVSKLIIIEQDSPFTVVAPITDPRIDYVYIDSAGALQIEQGAEAVSPVVESYRGRIVLAEIYVTVGMTQITEAAITDVRSMVGGGGGAGGNATIEVYQVGHGFVVGDILRWDGSGNVYVKAQADVEANANAIGMVSEVHDSNSFEMTLLGVVSGLTGLVSGSLYYLSELVQGAMTVTEPSVDDEVSKPVFIATSTTGGFFFNWRGLKIPFGGGAAGGYVQTFVNADLVAGVLTVNHAKAEEIQHVTVYDDVKKSLQPDDVETIDANNLKIDLSSYGVIPGTWKLVV